MQILKRLDWTRTFIVTRLRKRQLLVVRRQIRSGSRRTWSARNSRSSRRTRCPHLAWMAGFARIPCTSWWTYKQFVKSFIISIFFINGTRNCRCVVTLLWLSSRPRSSHTFFVCFAIGHSIYASTVSTGSRTPCFLVTVQLSFVAATVGTHVTRWSRSSGLQNVQVDCSCGNRRRSWTFVVGLHEGLGALFDGSFVQWLWRRDGV